MYHQLQFPLFDRKVSEGQLPDTTYLGDWCRGDLDRWTTLFGNNVGDHLLPTRHQSLALLQECGQVSVSCHEGLCHQFLCFLQNIEKYFYLQRLKPNFGTHELNINRPKGQIFNISCNELPSYLVIYQLFSYLFV